MDEKQHAFSLPYTEVTEGKPLNLKPRQVECVYCHYIILSDLPSPRCGTCHHQLITVVPNVKLANGYS